MNKLLIATSAIALAISQIAITATASLAAIPPFNYTCPGKIKVHADQGGPVYINGKKASLKVFNKNYGVADLRYESSFMGFLKPILKPTF